MTQNHFKKFFLRSLLFASPFILLSLPFFILDPFKLFFTYSDYTQNVVATNACFISTETYLKNREKHRYDSFLFGNSRTIAYHVRDWQPYIGDGMPFRFDAEKESVGGMLLKLRLIDKMGDPIRHAILLMDRDIVENIQPPPGHMFLPHPELTGRPWPFFYYEFFKGYWNRGFFYKFLDFKIFGRYKSYMGDVFFRGTIPRDPVTNEIFLKPWDVQIEKDSLRFWQRSVFLNRDKLDPWSQKALITEKHLPVLREIHSILKKHRTHFRIVISPLYDGIYYNRKDLGILKDIFGSANVFDFTGPNEFTENVQNFYDATHYRPQTGKCILAFIYKDG